MQLHITGLGAAILIATALLTPSQAANQTPETAIVQAVVPPAGTADADKPISMDERMQRRFPQPVRVGDLIGLRMLDDDDFTIGFVRQVVRTPQNRIKLIVSYGGWSGWGARPVAVPIEVVAILGRQLASIDMPRSDYATVPTWQGAEQATVLSDDDSIRVALGRR